MLYVTWLLLGSWAHVQINADVEAPVTGLSVGTLYASGVFFAVRRARGSTRMSTIKTVIFLITGKLDFSAVNPHARHPT